MSARPIFYTILLVALITLPRLATAQEVTRESRSVASFTAVEFAVPGTLHLRQGDASSVEVEAPQAALAKITTTVEGETLKISTEGRSGLLNFLSGDDELEADQIDAYVTVSTLSRITQAGSGRVRGETPLQEDALALNVAGSGGMDLEVDVNTLDVSIAGSGTCTLRGRAGTMNVNIAGSGDLRGDELSTRTTEVRIAGSGDVNVGVTESLAANIFGSGDVRYRGGPTVETNVVGSGEVQTID